MGASIARQAICIANLPRGADIAGRDLDSPNLHGFLVDPDMYLAPNPAFGATVLARVPRAFALGLDAGAVDQKVERASSATIWQTHVQHLLATAKGAEIGHHPVQSDHPQQALDETRGLPNALRVRFQEYIEEGLSGRAAAAQLKLSPATGVRWLRRIREAGTAPASVQGRPRGHGKLAPHQDFLGELVAQDGDITLPELAGALEAATGVVAHSASIGRFLRKLM